MRRQLFATKPLSLLLDEMKGENRLRRILGPVQLSSLGVGAIIGTGIFVLTGQAAHDKAGPALILSFVVSGIACIFAALCYAEFASMVPVAGSAYTYAYATMGELFAWIIGWDLVLEYTVVSATVAHGWSAYFQDFIGIFGLKVPGGLHTAPFDYNPALGKIVSTGTVLDLPAIVITVILTAVLIKGIRESASINTTMVGIKLAAVLFVIGVGAFYVNPANWHPFAPYGWKGLSFFGGAYNWGTVVNGLPVGMLAGAGIMFFAYIGFDCVSTQAEEARNPQRDVPIGIIASLLICTVLYIAFAAVLTGMVPYDKIDIDAPVAAAFSHVGLSSAQFVITLGALAGMTSVILGLMLGQPRVLLAMSRDGLLPKSFFADIHPRFRTPWKSSILTGIAVATLSAILPLDTLLQLVNIGTLLAFVIVCLAVLVMRRANPDAVRPFRCPFVPVTPVLGALLCFVLMLSLPSGNWLRLLVWLLVGFVIYFFYGRHHSVLAKIRADKNS